jgi:hypothetical protein
MLFRNPRAFAFLLIAIGIGLLGYYGEQLWRLPTWSEAEIAQSVELNLALDLRHRGPHLQPTPEKLAELRATVRAEVEADIRRERETLERWLGLGAILCMLGTGHFVKQLLAERARPN